MAQYNLAFTGEQIDNLLSKINAPADTLTLITQALQAGGDTLYNTLIQMPYATRRDLLVALADTYLEAIQIGDADHLAAALPATLAWLIASANPLNIAYSTNPFNPFTEQTDDPTGQSLSHSLSLPIDTSLSTTSPNPIANSTLASQLATDGTAPAGSIGKKVYDLEQNSGGGSSSPLDIVTNVLNNNEIQILGGVSLS
ncbi:MAG: hypothetical protein IJU90_05655, partial [Bacteroidales bacterium]|nr:hypothetical protein [Bacteroidales bacterium]